MTAELISKTACEIVDLLTNGDITPFDLLDALETRIADVDGEINALPTLCFERARNRANAEHALARTDRRHLAGMPIAIKDLVDVAGVRSTKGSPIFKDSVPENSDVLVEHLERNGALVYAMSNTSEFGAGANTVNEVFGYTRNPWNTSRSVAGSSGGAAASLATGMAWLAHGSDMAGSLRSPASFCGVCGMRPSPGRVAETRLVKVDGNLGQNGPMARTVEDLALLFDAMVGEQPCDPVSLPQDGTYYLDASRSGWKPSKVAVSQDLGITPVDPEVSELVRRTAHKLESAGVIVEEAHPDLKEAHECFQILRALAYVNGMKGLLDTHGQLLKPDIVWNIEQGLKLTAEDIVRAEHQRADMFHRTLAFFRTYDLLLCPTTIVPPYPIEDQYVQECNGKTFDNYVEWLAVAYAITNICCPAISIPAGFTTEGLPVGIQLIAPPKAEAHLLAGAKLLEDILDVAIRIPIAPRLGT